ncbi:Gag-Pol polyprotein [Plecturocebus cupreus]
MGRYVFATVHVHGAIYQEHGLLTLAGKTIKNKEILALLEVVWLPLQVAVIHCKGHQKENAAVARGNQRADSAAREAARLAVTPLTLLLASTLWKKKNKHWIFRPVKTGTDGGFSHIQEFSCPRPLERLCAHINARQGPKPGLGCHLRGWSDNGPAFTSSIVQSVSKALNIQWKLHCASRPQSSGQVECMNRTLKSTLKKLILEIIRCTPYKAGFSPFEIMYGRAPPILPRLNDTHLAEISLANLLQHLQSLQQVQDIIQLLVCGAHPNPVPDLTGPCYPFCPGDLVYVKKFQKEELTPAWKGPHTVTLTTPTAQKVDGIPAWIHYSCTNKAGKHPEETWVSQPGSGPLMLRLSRVELPR